MYAIFDEYSWQYLCKDNSWCYVEMDVEISNEIFKQFDIFSSERLALAKIEQLRKEFLAESTGDDFYFTLHRFEPVVAYSVNEVSDELKMEIAKANGK